MPRFAIYGKGGSGKSMIAANLSVHFARRGLKTLQIGCDPKHDSTRTLTGGRRIQTVVELLQTVSEKNLARLDERAYLVEGIEGIGCIETGGPDSGTGCAGLGIVSAFRLFAKHALLGKFDIVLMDVLGDVVCGGFAMPLTRGLASGVVIVVSDTVMSLYAANNIARAVERYHRNGVRLAGLVVNSLRNRAQLARIEKFARSLSSVVLAGFPHDDRILEAEGRCVPVSVLHRRSDLARRFAKLGDTMLSMDLAKRPPPTPLDDGKWEAFVREFVA